MAIIKQSETLKKKRFGSIGPTSGGKGEAYTAIEKLPFGGGGVEG